jgi:hypothetical protein
MNTNDGKNQANADSTGQEHNVENWDKLINQGLIVIFKVKCDFFEDFLNNEQRFYELIKVFRVKQ